MRRRLAFTLIELLTVMAITAILMSLIIVPVFQSFNLTRAAQAFSEAQNTGRILTEKVAQEIANSTGVRDNSGTAGMVAIVVPGANGQLETVLLPYTKLDIVNPARGEPIRGASGALINPDTGKEDPTLRSPKGQVVLSVARGATILRYFVGLNRPLNNAGTPANYNDDTAGRYNNPYDGLLMARNGNQDNLFVLRRAEVQPYVWDATLQRFVVNTNFFADANNDNVPDDLDDPYFFVLDAPGTTPLTGAARTDKIRRIHNWEKAGQIVTSLSRFDMIQPVYDKRTRAVVMDLNPNGVRNVPRLLALAQFRPTRVSNEPAEGMTAVRLGQEAEGMAYLAPDVFRTQYGQWSSAFLQAWPTGWVPGARYIVGRFDGTVANNFRAYVVQDGVDAPATGGIEVFNVTTYLNAVAGGAMYPFSLAAAPAAGASVVARNVAIPFWIDAGAGKAIMSFGIDEVGNSNTTPPINSPKNLPFSNAGPELTPVNDSSLGGNFYDPAYATINKKFNKVWADNPTIRPNIHRFVDLRNLPNADGTPSPLNPDPSIGFARASIVPGSEIIIAGDQNPGPHYGRPIRYTRTTGEPGPNQYRINYTNLPEPTDYTLLGFAGNPPAVYTPTDFLSAVIQPRFKTGYVQFNSDPNIPMPTGQYSFFYRFQFTKAQDVVSIDYDSRQLMSILLTMRNYPQAQNIPNPQTITLKSTATVRNFYR